MWNKSSDTYLTSGFENRNLERYAVYLTCIDSPFAFSLPLFDSGQFPLCCVLFGKDISHGIVSLGLFLVIDGGYLEPVAVNNVLLFPSG